MSQTPVAGWQDKLADVERSISECLSTLDKYEAAFARTIGDVPVSRPPVSVPNASPVWDEKLAAASRQADDVERLLAEQEAVWSRWRATFANWQQLLTVPRTTTPSDP